VLYVAGRKGIGLDTGSARLEMENSWSRVFASPKLPERGEISDASREAPSNAGADEAGGRASPGQYRL